MVYDSERGLAEQHYSPEADAWTEPQLIYETDTDPCQGIILQELEGTVAVIANWNLYCYDGEPPDESIAAVATGDLTEWETDLTRHFDGWDSVDLTEAAPPPRGSTRTTGSPGGSATASTRRSPTGDAGPGSAAAFRLEVLQAAEDVDPAVLDLPAALLGELARRLGDGLELLVGISPRPGTWPAPPGRSPGEPPSRCPPTRRSHHQGPGRAPWPPGQRASTQSPQLAKSETASSSSSDEVTPMTPSSPAGYWCASVAALPAAATTVTPGHLRT